MNVALKSCGIVANDNSSAVLSVWMAPDLKYAFVELLNADVAAVAMAFSGIDMNGSALKISKPNTYTQSASIGASSAMIMPVGLM